MDIFDKVKELLSNRKRSYKNTFNLESKSSVEVLEDLAAFCRANETTFQADPRLHAVLEGRREVWLRIQHHLQLKDEDLWKLYGRKNS
jgi:plasmid maintenance system antidote protein VapI